jgi:hypothetical protein
MACSDRLVVLLLFILTAYGFLPGGSGTTLRHTTQINRTIKRNIVHKTTHTINTLHRMNTAVTTTIIFSYGGLASTKKALIKTYENK